VEYTYYDIDRLRFGGTLTGGTFSISSPNTTLAEPVWSANLHIAYLLRRQAVYVQDLIAITPSLKIMLGARYDDVSRHQDNVLAPASSIKTRYHEWSKRFGITYELTNGVVAFAGYSQSFVPPGDENTTSLGTLPASDPEHGEQFETGMKFDIGEAFTATAAIYQLTRDNVRTTDTLGNTSIVGEQQSRGIEFDATWKILPNWNLMASYAQTIAKVAHDKTYSAGNRLVNAPRNSARLWSVYEIGSGVLKNFSFGGGVGYVGERAANLVNNYKIPDYWTVDLTAAYKFTDNLAIKLNANNVFDRTYYVASSGDDRPFLYYGDPATVTVRLQVTY
jgi:iron complex outermembrane recepter protein